MKRQVTAVSASILIALMISSDGAAGTDYSVPAATHHTIEISGFKFKPDRLEIAVGDTVTWINKDIVPHNIAVNEPEEVLSPILKKGDEFTFEVKATLPYICGLHPGMKGEIIVAKSTARIQGIPCKTDSALMDYADTQDRQVQRHITAYLALESNAKRCL